MGKPSGGANQAFSFGTQPFYSQHNPGMQPFQFGPMMGMGYNLPPLPGGGGPAGQGPTPNLGAPSATASAPSQGGYTGLPAPGSSNSGIGIGGWDYSKGNPAWDPLVGNSPGALSYAAGNAPINPATDQPYQAMNAEAAAPAVGGWYGTQFIPDFTGTAPYGSPSVAGTPYYFYGQGQGSYPLDQSAQAGIAGGGWNNADLNKWAQQWGFPDYGRMSYVLSFMGNGQGIPLPATNPYGPQAPKAPTYYDSNTNKFVTEDKLTNPNDLAALTASKYGYLSPNGSTPDYQNIMSTLQAQGWDAGKGYGAQDWVALRKAAGMDSSPDASTYNYLNDLLSLVAPSPTALTFEQNAGQIFKEGYVPGWRPGTRPSWWPEWAPDEGGWFGGPLRGETQPPPLDAASAAYVNNTLGGSHFGGIVPTPKPLAADPWATLQQMGFNPSAGIWPGQQSGIQWGGIWGYPWNTSYAGGGGER